MGDLVKYTARSAVASHKQFQRQGSRTRQSGGSGKRSIVDGYIASTVISGDNSITTVIDLPAYLLWMSRFNAGSSWYFGLGARYGVRDDYLPDTVPQSKVVDFSTTYKLSPTGYQYIAPDYDVVDAGAGRAYVHGLPTLSGDWVYGIPHVRVPTIPAGLDDDLVMVVYGVRWSAPMPESTANNALVQPDPDATFPPTSSRVLCVPAVSLAIEAGVPGARTRQLPNNVFIASVQVREVVESVLGQDVVRVRAFTAVGGRNAGAGSEVDRPLVIVGRVTMGVTQELPVDWGAAPSLGAGYVDAHSLNVLESIGLHVGTAVTVCAVVHDDYLGGGSFYATRLVTLNPDTGAVLSNTAFTEYPDLAQPICSTANALWVARATTSADVSTSCSLYRVVDGVASTVDLGGWMPLCTLLSGIPRSAGLWTLGAMAPVVVDLGGGRVGVLACAPGSYGAATAISWRLLEVDEATLSVVSDRGAVGTVSVTQLVAGNPRPISLTVVTPQRVVDGVVNVPAVLLRCVGTVVGLSTDGGSTWTTIATGLNGYPYYFGNKAHPFTTGESL